MKRDYIKEFLERKPRGKRNPSSHPWKNPVSKENAKQSNEMRRQIKIYDL